MTTLIKLRTRKPKKMATITTNRLMLRPLTIDDAEAAFEWTGDERVARYMIYSTHESVETTKEWLRSINTSDTAYEFGFVRRSDNKLIGAPSPSRHRATDRRVRGPPC